VGLSSRFTASVAAGEPPVAGVERAAHFEEALLRAKATGKDIVRRCLDRALPSMTPAERLEVLVACNQELRQEKWVKPESYPYDAIETFFLSQGERADKNLLTLTIAAGIRKASESGDVPTYQLWNDMAARRLPPVKPEDVHLTPAQAAAAFQYARFAGELLSQDGMLRTSSASPRNRPLFYAQVLSGGFGGWLNTNYEEKPWAQVQLANAGELTGIVLVNCYEQPTTMAEFQSVVPLRISISLDDKTWTEVALFDHAFSEKAPLSAFSATRYGIIASLC
jgi:hypothetical protein